MNNKRYQTLFSILLVLAMVLSIATPAAAGTSASEKSSAKYEIKFMKNMIDHHMMAVMQAEMCLENAEHEELIQLCENIITTQTEEMMMMQMWLLEWYGISYDPQMKKNGMGRMGMMEGEEFEVEFLQMMIKHHRGAIKDSTKCLDRAFHPELLDLCQNIISAQSQEIQMMQAWLCEWYGVCKNN